MRKAPAAALARYVRTLASNPKDFDGLIGAGRAALQLGDAQAAAGFFARADDVNPRSPLPQAGMGAVSVANGNAQAALPYFKRAQQLGATLPMIGCDLGLAYDLLGRQPAAQADYRAALGGPDADEARRRLALSLAISGDKNGALAALAPLMAQRDVATAGSAPSFLLLPAIRTERWLRRTRQCPAAGHASRPFLQRLPALQPGQKAAAVNLGIFPDSNVTAYAYNAAPAANFPAPSTTTASVTTDRLAGVDELLRQPAPAQPSWQPAQQPSWQTQPTQVAFSAPVSRQQQSSRSAPQFPPRKIWLQLASGSDAAALSGQFERIRSKDRDLFDGITGYVAKGRDRARLVIGPFHSASDADTFAADLETMKVNAFKWSNSPADQIVPLATE